MRKKDLLFVIISTEIALISFIPIKLNLGPDLARLSFYSLVDKYFPLFFIILPILLIGMFWLYERIAKGNILLLEVAKFIDVGVLNTLLDWGILNFEMLISGITQGKWYLLFKGASFSVAVLNSYFFNKVWVFESKEKKILKEMGVFLIVSLMGLGINVLVAGIVVNLIGPKFGISSALWANFGAFLATLFSMVWNFLGYKLVVFKK